MLPSYAADALEKRKIGGKRTPVNAVEPDLKPTRYCECCAKFFDMKRIVVETLQAGICVDCRKLLDAGWTGFYTADRYAFGKSELLADMAGKVVVVSNRTMDEIAKQYEVKKKESNGQQTN